MLWVNDFHALLFNSRPENRNRGYFLLKENRPKTFCRYIGRVDHINSYLESFFLWYSHPDSFEDRYDARWSRFSSDVNILNTEDNGDLQYYLDEYIHHDSKGDKPEPACTDNGEMKSSNDPPIKTPDDIDPPRNVLKLCSFTTNPLSPLMWEDYGNHSEGICIEYDMGRTQFSNPWQLQETPYPMIYTDEPYDLTDFVLDDGNPGWNGNFRFYFGLIKTLLKSSECQYENEWRSIIPQQRYEGLDMQTLPNTIYLGCRVTQDMKEQVLRSAEANFYSVNQVVKNGDRLDSVNLFTP